MSHRHYSRKRRGKDTHGAFRIATCHPTITRVTSLAAFALRTLITAKCIHVGCTKADAGTLRLRVAAHALKALEAEAIVPLVAVGGALWPTNDTSLGAVNGNPLLRPELVHVRHSSVDSHALDRVSARNVEPDFVSHFFATSRNVQAILVKVWEVALSKDIGPHSKTGENVGDLVIYEMWEWFRVKYRSYLG